MICKTCTGTEFVEIELFSGVEFVCVRCGDRIKEDNQAEEEQGKFTIYGFYDIIKAIKGFFKGLIGVRKNGKN